ncbi:MAG TPA: histidinol-phosphatase HisJ family protein [Dehalococcoidia bacterium]|jgi:histidinol-phosphatase (PHP family)|nr:histidinol-phosphatase HisJ family protein [Dehalococcoidia bacterium]HIK88177.1 histidinol-phosphatase HisJ family protein [Dehalococcoidia bacterium]
MTQATRAIWRIRSVGFSVAIAEPWKVSLHGGHSGDFCAHGHDTLREMLDAAVSFGYSTFGVTAHSAAVDPKFLYEEEVEAGLGVDDLAQTFRDYASTCAELVTEYSDRIEVLVGAEVEIVPESSFADQAAKLKQDFHLDYLVGSVHWVDEMPFDTTSGDFEKAVANRGGLEPFVLRYFQLISEMIDRVKPEVIGHFDLPRLFSDGAPELESSAVKSAVASTLEKASAAGSILDLNVGSLAKGLSTPYPAPWIVRLATDIGVPFCFGDDSHSIAQVGAGLVEGREYLLANGVESITSLKRESGTIVKTTMPLSR